MCRLPLLTFVCALVLPGLGFSQGRESVEHALPEAFGACVQVLLHKPWPEHDDLLEKGFSDLTFGFSRRYHFVSDMDWLRIDMSLWPQPSCFLEVSSAQIEAADAGQAFSSILEANGYREQGPASPYVLNGHRGVLLENKAGDRVQLWAVFLPDTSTKDVFAIVAERL